MFSNWRRNNKKKILRLPHTPQTHQFVWDEHTFVWRKCLAETVFYSIFSLVNFAHHYYRLSVNGVPFREYTYILYMRPCSLYNENAFGRYVIITIALWGIKATCSAVAFTALAGCDCGWLWMALEFWVVARMLFHVLQTRRMAYPWRDRTEHQQALISLFGGMFIS